MEAARSARLLTMMEGCERAHGMEAWPGRAAAVLPAGGRRRRGRWAKTRPNPLDGSALECQLGWEKKKS
jgi:hypothetical protein